MHYALLLPPEKAGLVAAGEGIQPKITRSASTRGVSSAAGTFCMRRPKAMSNTDMCGNSAALKHVLAW